MKKTIFILTALLFAGITTTAQEYIIVDGPYSGDGESMYFIPLSEIDSLTYEEHTTKSRIFLSDILAEDENISIYAEALQATGLDDSLHAHLDYNYHVDYNLTRWTSNIMITPVTTDYDNVAYPNTRMIKFTAFVVQDKILKEKYGIENLKGLRQLAATIYDEMYPEDAQYYDDMTDRRNSLNRFMAYHILNRYGSYYTLTAVDEPDSELAAKWNRNVWDIADWYETMMPHSLMKFSFPKGENEGLYINRRGVQSGADERGVFIQGSRVCPQEEMTVRNEAINGIYHYIDDIVHYGRETQEVVLDERMRIDATTLSPDFMTSRARGHYSRFGKYAYGDSKSDITNRRTCIGFMPRFVENFYFAWQMHVRPRTLNFWNYQGDEVVIKGSEDIKFKLPSLPAGTYELRIGTQVGWPSGVYQFLIDGVVMRDNVDFSIPGTNPSIGWLSDQATNNVDSQIADAAYFITDESKEIYNTESGLKDLEDITGVPIAVWEYIYDLPEDNRYDYLASYMTSYIGHNDAFMRNKGWMKGPASYYTPNSFRDLANILRCIIGTFTTDGKTDHYLTIKTLDHVRGRDYFLLDYIELCPSSVYDNASVPEDKW